MQQRRQPSLGAQASCLHRRSRQDACAPRVPSPAACPVAADGVGFPVLQDDGALGGVVGALGGIGSHILALQKSEPSLEDVFVELVGRGFDEDEPERETPPGPPIDPDRIPDDTSTVDDEEAVEVA